MARMKVISEAISGNSCFGHVEVAETSSKLDYVSLSRRPVCNNR